MPNKMSLKDLMYQQILEDILRSAYQPGDILNEKTLMEKYSCGKTPVREALLSLCDDQVLKNIPRYGYEVIRLTTDDINEMIEYRFALEGGLLRLHCGFFSEAQFRALQNINEQIRCSAEDIFSGRKPTAEDADSDEYVWKHWQYNADFHETLIGFCGNTFALDELTRCMNRLKRAYAQFYWGKWSRQMPPVNDTRHHIDILTALQKKDADAAVRYLAADLNDFGGLTARIEI